MIRYMEFPDGLVNILWSGEIDERRPYKRSSNPKDLKLAFAPRNRYKGFVYFYSSVKVLSRETRTQQILDVWIFY